MEQTKPCIGKTTFFEPRENFHRSCEERAAPAHVIGEVVLLVYSPPPVIEIAGKFRQPPDDGAIRQKVRQPRRAARFLAPDIITDAELIQRRRVTGKRRVQPKQVVVGRIHEQHGRNRGRDKTEQRAAIVVRRRIAGFVGRGDEEEIGFV